MTKLYNRDFSSLRLREKTQKWLSKRENILFIALIIISLLPIWLFTYFPSQDGPRHLEIAQIIRQYYSPESSKLYEYYLINSTLSPNWFIYIILIGLMNIFPPLLAEKILLSGYIILLPISMRYALYGIRPQSVFLSFLAFPLIYNWMLHKGFYNFCYSLPLFFFVIGYWFKHQNRFTPLKIFILTGLVILLYFCHLFSLVMAFTAIVISSIWLIFTDITEKSFDLRSLIRFLLRRSAIVLSTFAPILILSFIFVQKSGVDQASTIWSKRLWQFKNLLAFASLTSYDKIEILFSTAFVFLLIATILSFFLYQKINLGLNKSEINLSKQLFLIFVAYLIIYFISPSETFTSISIKERLVYYPYFIIILWLGTQVYSKQNKTTIKIGAIIISLMFLLTHSSKYLQLNNYLQEYLSGQNLIEPNSTLLPLSFDNYIEDNKGKKLAGKIETFVHASGYLALQKPIVNLNNFPASTDYFPIRYRPQLNPYTHISLKRKKDLERTPPIVEFLTYGQRTGGQVDYVLVWNFKEKYRNWTITQSIFQQLEKGYQLIYTSPQRGLMQLYRRKQQVTSSPTN